jgi:hypothetical protein
MLSRLFSRKLTGTVLLVEHAFLEDRLARYTLYIVQDDSGTIVRGAREGMRNDFGVGHCVYIQLQRLGLAPVYSDYHIEGDAFESDVEQATTEWKLIHSMNKVQDSL